MITADCRRPEPHPPHSRRRAPQANARHALQQLIQHSAARPRAVAVFDEDDRRDSWLHPAGLRSPTPENLQQETPQLREASPNKRRQLAFSRQRGGRSGGYAGGLSPAGGHQVTIVSTDGYCQLLAPNADPRLLQKRWLDMPFVQQEFGVQRSRTVWGWRGSAAARSPAWRVSGQNRRAAVAAVGQPGRFLLSALSRCRRNGAASWSSASWPTSANRWPRCAPICRWTVTAAAAAPDIIRRCKQRPLSGLTRLIAARRAGPAPTTCGARVR